MCGCETGGGGGGEKEHVYDCVSAFVCSAEGGGVEFVLVGAREREGVHVSVSAFVWGWGVVFVLVRPRERKDV